MMNNLKDIEKVANKFDNDLLQIKKEIKRVQSLKCNLKKNKFKSNYETEMRKILDYEQILKEARQLVDPKEKFVTEYEQSDVDKLDYDQTMKAIKSIQSKKFHTKYTTPEPGQSDEYKNACRIENMLLEHKKTVQPVEDSYIRRSDLQTIIDTIESSGNLSQEAILELLKKL